MINPEPTKKEKYKEHLKKLILNFAETMDDFLADFFCLLFFHRSVKATSKDATLFLRHIETIGNKVRE